MGCYVYFFDFQGNLLWQKNFESSNSTEIIKYAPTEISNNGSAIVITKALSGILINMVFDHSGNLLFEKPTNNIVWFRLKPTPDGEYFYEKQSAVECRVNGFYIYDRTGKEIELTGYNFEQERFIRPVFINDNIVVIYMEDKISFFDFNKGNFDLISEYDLNTYHSFREAFQDEVIYNQEYVLVSDIKSLAISLLFDYNGNFIRQCPVHQTVAFINSDELLLRRYSKRNPYLKRLNIMSNQIIDYEYSLLNREHYSEIIELNDNLIISYKFWFAKENPISSLVVDKESLLKVSGLNELTISTNKSVIFISLEDNKCSVTFGYIEE